MKLIVWLWNPSKKYEKTRHNLWFMFLDFFALKNSFPNFKKEDKYKWEISQWNFMWEKTILLKPQTYMNLSWEAIYKIKNFYKIDLDDIIVIFDDFSMNFWKIRFRDKWSSWWHNWIKNIISYFGNSFKRIKIWIWFNDFYSVDDWVLSKFEDKDLEELEKNVFLETINILKDKI